ncbi:MAG: MMPL family transporter [Dehalococcoidia bacterium]
MARAPKPASQSALERWARLAHRRRGRVIAAWAVFLVAIVIGDILFAGKFSTAFSLPGSESQKAIDLLEAKFPQRAGSEADLVFESATGFDDPAIRGRVDTLLAEVEKAPHVVGVDSPFAQSGYLSTDGTIARSVIIFDVQGDDLAHADLDRVVKQVDAANGDGLRVEIGGQAMFNYEAPEFGSEALGLLAAIIILFIAFGSVMAMGLPIAAAVAGILAGAGIVTLLARVFQFPDFTAQFVAMIGIGVGIDYSLLVVTRFREGLHHGKSVEDSIALAVTTAGRSVIFAGVVVAIAFFGLWAMGLPFIAMLGTASALVVAMAVLVSLTLMPALLSLVGRRIDRWRVPFLHSTEGVDRASGWYRLATAIQRRPLPYAVAATVFLLAIASPVLAMRVGFTDAGNNDEKFHTRRAYDLLAKGFGAGFNGPLTVVLDFGTAKASGLEPVSAAIVKTEGVSAVLPPILSPDGTTALIPLFPDAKPQDQETTDTVHRLRDTIPAVAKASGAEAYVAGSTAVSIDIGDKITQRLPFLFAGVIGLSFLLLMAVFRSVLVALKAAIMNLLSIGAAYGVVVAVFQWGWGGSILGVEKGPIEVFMPMMFFAILFGLSMDYEVFLISRIRESYVRHKDNGKAVAEGLAATARVITAAAAIMVAVFLAFVLGDDRVVKMVGIGLATAIFVDATVVRLILVPATMELLGNANWWMPAWLDRILPEIHIEDTHLETPDAPVYAGAPAAGGQ